MIIWEPRWAKNNGSGCWWLLAIAGGFLLAEIAHAAAHYEQWAWMVR